jgi:hypothetical protein
MSALANRDIKRAQRRVQTVSGLVGYTPPPAGSQRRVDRTTNRDIEVPRIETGLMERRVRHRHALHNDVGTHWP